MECEIFRSNGTAEPTTHSNLATLEGRPIDTSEPRMPQDILSTSNQVTKTLRAVRMQKGSDEITGERVNMGWPANFSLENLFINAKRIVVEERL